ncbi:MAG: PorT family protein [Prolixibacteraceae bacterium]|nr:PorT family protein [Prolixibacteraceae bacterium]MBN2775530.1 PorT family protein [Prolixibacteraceae bacterium]
MKKLFILIIFSLAISSIYAQRFEAGLLGGFNATQVDGDLYKGFHKPGIVAGAFVQTDIAPAVFAGFEIKYSQKGSRNKVDPKKTDIEKYIMRLGYVELPVFVGFRANDRGSIIGGISTGYLISAGEWRDNDPLPKEDVKAFKSIDLQPFLGFQFDMLDNLTLDLRLAYSILPIRGQPGENATNYYWLNNQFSNVISLAAYYKINAGRY